MRPPALLLLVGGGGGGGVDDEDGCGGGGGEPLVLIGGVAVCGLVTAELVFMMAASMVSTLMSCLL